MGFKPGLVIGVIVFLVLIVAFTPVIGELINSASEKYLCRDTAFPYQCRDESICSNTTYGVCLNESIPIYNGTLGLCTNESGVSVINASSSDPCSSEGYFESAEHVGISAVEVTLLGLTLLFLIIGMLLGFANSSGLAKTK